MTLIYEIIFFISLSPTAWQEILFYIEEQKHNRRETQHNIEIWITTPQSQALSTIASYTSWKWGKEWFVKIWT